MRHERGERYINMTKKIHPGRVLRNVSGHHNNGNSKGVIDVTTGNSFVSQTDCAETLKAHVSTVSNCCNGQLKTCKGHRLYSAHDDVVSPLCDRVQELYAENEVQRAELAEQRQKLNLLREETRTTHDLIAAAVRKRNGASERRDHLRQLLEMADLEYTNAEKELNDLLAKLG